MKTNKKGISAIVATVLIILITVAAVTIIWAAIIPMINDTLKSSTECIDASAALRVITDYSCYNAEAGSCSDGVSGTQAECIAKDCDEATNGTQPCVWTGYGAASIQVQRGTGDFELVGLDLILGYEGTTNTTRITTNLPTANGAKVYTVLNTTMGLAEIREASVAAVVKTGNSQTTCEVSGSVTLPDC